MTTKQCKCTGECWRTEGSDSLCWKTTDIGDDGYCDTCREYLEERAKNTE